MQNQAGPLRRARLALGLTTTEAGQYVHVTRKTWESWEVSEAVGKPVPKAKSELFFSKLDSLGKARGLSEQVVVLLEDPSTHIRMQIPIDVVSANNYLGYEEAADGWQIIKSMAIDRITGLPYVHRTKFDPSANAHVVDFCKRNKPLA